MANERIGTNAYRFQRNVTLDASSVPAASFQVETFTVAGLKASGGPVVVNKMVEEAGLALVHSRVSADNTLALTFHNISGAPVNPASQTYKVVQL